MQMPKELVIQVSNSIFWQVLVTLFFACRQEEMVPYECLHVNLFWDWDEVAFKVKKWHFRSDMVSSVTFLTSVSLPMQLILGVLIITPCKKRRQSISAASCLALLTFLSSNSCSCCLFSHCPKHGIKGGTKKMARNVFETEICLFSRFNCFSLTSFSWGFFPPHLLMCVQGGFISDVSIV